MEGSFIKGGNSAGLHIGSIVVDIVADIKSWKEHCGRYQWLEEALWQIRIKSWKEHCGRYQGQQGEELLGANTVPKLTAD